MKLWVYRQKPSSGYFDGARSHADTALQAGADLSPTPYVDQRPDHQRLDWIGTMELAVLLDGNASSGRLTVIEVQAQRGDASPIHVHSNEDETFIVIEGGMIVWVGDQRHHIEAGGIGFLPSNLPHCYRFTADRTRALNICRPSGLENFFRTAGWDLSRPQPDGWTVNQQILAETSARHGAPVLGPPR